MSIVSTQGKRTLCASCLPVGCNVTASDLSIAGRQVVTSASTIATRSRQQRVPGSQLGVHGFEGLYVVDASVMPNVTRAM